MKIKLNKGKFIAPVIIYDLSHEKQIKLNGLIDTGATISFVKEKTLKQLGYKQFHKKAKIKTIGGNFIHSSYRCIHISFIDKIPIHIGEVITLRKNDENDMVIGMDVLRFYEFSFNHHTETLKIIPCKCK